MLHILYRGTSHSSGTSHERPEGFSYDKCLNNILSTIENNSNVVFHLIWDGKYEGNHSRIDKVVEFKGGSDKNSFFYTWDYAKNLKLNEKDLIYFLENDYLHINNWYEKIIDIFETYDIDGYISLYDHLDKYTLDYSDLVSQIYVTKSSHWRTVPSTCGSFIINKKTLDNDYDIHTSLYSDHDKFIWLGQNRNRIVLTPLPSLSTHCVKQFMAPIINWENIQNKY
jgi:hypothetical protein